jgi:hypothetical protein
MEFASCRGVRAMDSMLSFGIEYVGVLSPRVNQGAFPPKKCLPQGHIRTSLGQRKSLFIVSSLFDPRFMRRFSRERLCSVKALRCASTACAAPAAAPP